MKMYGRIFLVIQNGGARCCKWFKDINVECESCSLDLWLHFDVSF
jgi:hypothetical protein